MYFQLIQFGNIIYNHNIIFCFILGKHYTLDFPLFTKHQLTSQAAAHYGQPYHHHLTQAITFATTIITYQTLTSNFIN